MLNHGIHHSKGSGNATGSTYLLQEVKAVKTEAEPIGVEMEAVKILSLPHHCYY
jgi:hypothetical protein